MADDVVRTMQMAHHSILETIGQVQLFLRNYPKVKPLIRELHQKLINHFGRQNDSFFAPLKANRSLERNDLKMLEALEVDLKDIKVKLLVFYDQHSGEMDDTNARSFPLDFADLSGFIQGRIKMENDYLFPLLEKTSVH